MLNENGEHRPRLVGRADDGSDRVAWIEQVARRSGHATGGLGTDSLVLASAVLVLDPGTSWAICQPPPLDSLSYEEMIQRETTGLETYPIMFLGVVVTTKNLGGHLALASAHPHPELATALEDRVLLDRPHVNGARSGTAQDRE